MKGRNALQQQEAGNLVDNNESNSTPEVPPSAATQQAPKVDLNHRLRCKGSTGTVKLFFVKKGHAFFRSPGTHDDIFVSTTTITQNSPNKRSRGVERRKAVVLDTAVLLVSRSPTSLGLMTNPYADASRLRTHLHFKCHCISRHSDPCPSVQYCKRTPD